MTAVILGFFLGVFGVLFHDHIYPLLKRFVDAHERQAAALEDIADTLDIALCDDEEENHVSDSTRIVAALEKLAQIPPPAPAEKPKED